MKIRFWFLLLSLLAAMGSPWAIADSPPVRHFDEQQLRQLQADEAYYYDRLPPNPSLWESFWEWLQNWFKRQLGDDNINNMGYFWRKYLRYLVVLLLLGWAVQKILKAKIQHLFFKKNDIRTHTAPTEFGIERIETLNFEQLIANALAQKDYRLAVRWHYLQLLQRLSHKKHIDWQANKTNDDYQNELQASAYYQDFKQVRNLFDYVWYGEFPIDASRFAAVATQFRHIEQRIST